MKRGAPLFPCGPTIAETLLLKASLLRGEPALAAWRSWRALGDLDTVDAGSYRLLPLLYRNLAELAVNVPDLQRLKGVYRRTWYVNQLQLEHATALLTRLDSEGVASLLLGGVPLIPIYYKDGALRPVDGLDILVHPHDALRVMSLLEGYGWQPTVRPEAALSGLVAVDYCRYTADQNRQLNLRWHVLAERRRDDVDASFWEGSRPLDLSGVATRVLNAGDQLILSCLRGTVWAAVRPVYWVADAMFILDSPEQDVDWERILLKVSRYRLTLPLLDALTFLRGEMGAAIPQGVLEALVQTRVSMAERLDHRVRQQPAGTNGPAAEFISAWWRHDLTTVRQGLAARLSGLVAFLKQRWKVSHTAALPLQIIRQGGDGTVRAVLWWLNSLRGKRRSHT